MLVSDLKAKLEGVFNELDEWDALWLNGTETEKGYAVNSNLKKVRCMCGTFGYVVNHSWYDVIIDGLSNCLSSADEYYTSIQNEYQILATIKPLVKHKKGVSSIAGKVLNYSHLE